MRTNYFLTFVVIFILSSLLVCATTNLNSCQALNTFGEHYILTQNIVAAGTCFTISAHNITLNGAGFTLTGPGVTGVGVDNTGGFDNITVANFSRIHGFLTAIDATSMANSTIIHNTMNVSSTNQEVIELDQSSDNLIFNNSITNVGAIGHGIRVVTSSDRNVIANNSITTTNAGISNPIDIRSSSYLTIANNTLLATGNEGKGVSTNSGANFINISNNTITASNSNSNAVVFRQSLNSTVHGNFLSTTITTFGTLRITSDAHNMTFSYNSINASAPGGIGIRINSPAAGIVIENNSFPDVGSDYLDLTDANVTLVNQLSQVLQYDFNNINVSFLEEGIAELNFLSPVTEDSQNLSTDVFVSSNFVGVNSTDSPGFDVLANLTFFNTNSVGFPDKTILRNGSICPSGICTELQDADTYIFNVSGFSNYSLGMGCGVINRNVTIPNDLTSAGTCLTINTSDLLIDGNGFTIIGSGTLMGINGLFTFDNITIKNFANISNFTVGINLSTPNTLVENNTVSVIGVIGNPVAGGSGGILSAGLASSIENNTVFVDSTSSFTAGIISAGTSINVSDNTLRTESLTSTALSSFICVSCILENNDIVGSGGTGVFLGSDTSTLVRDNVITGPISGVTSMSTSPSSLPRIFRNNFTINADLSAITFGAATSANISDNIIFANGESIVIRLSRGSNNSIIQNNTVYLSINTSDGVNLVNSSNTTINNNTFFMFPGNDSRGVVMDDLANLTTITNNLFFGGGETDGGVEISNSSFVTITSNTITLNGTGAQGILIDVNSTEIDIFSNSITHTTGLGDARAISMTDGTTSTNISLNTFNIASGGIDLYDENGVDLVLNNQTVLGYSFNSTELVVENLLGRLQFLVSNITQSGINFSANLSITNNTIFVDSTSAPGFNSPANLTFFNTTNFSFIDRAPFRNGIFCPVAICTELQDADTYIFNVTQFTDYSVGETPVQNNQGTGGSTTIVPIAVRGSSGGGGGSGGSGASTSSQSTSTGTLLPPIQFPIKPTCHEQWVCDEWGECINGERTRVCNDKKECGTRNKPPAEKQDCEVVAEPKVTVVEEVGTLLEPVKSKFSGLITPMSILVSLSLIFVLLASFGIARTVRSVGRVKPSKPVKQPIPEEAPVEPLKVQPKKVAEKKPSESWVSRQISKISFGKTKSVSDMEADLGELKKRNKRLNALLKELEKK